MLQVLLGVLTSHVAAAADGYYKPGWTRDPCSKCGLEPATIGGLWKSAENFAVAVINPTTGENATLSTRGDANSCCEYGLSSSQRWTAHASQEVRQEKSNSYISRTTAVFRWRHILHLLHSDTLRTSVIINTHIPQT